MYMNNNYNGISHVNSLISYSDFTGYVHESLTFISFLAIATAIFVIASKNPIVSVLFLIFLFLTVSMYLMLLGLNFIGLSYLLVYVGAISILFLFILMLINIRISEIITTTQNSIPLAVIISIVFLYNLYPSLPIGKKIYTLKTHNIAHISNYNFDDINNYYSMFNLNPDFIQETVKTRFNNNNIDKIYNIFSNFNTTSSQNTELYIWDTFLADTGHINSIGNVLYTVYPIWIILTSLILLLAMIGCILITIK